MQVHLAQGIAFQNQDSVRFPEKTNTEHLIRSSVANQFTSGDFNQGNINDIFGMVQAQNAGAQVYRIGSNPSEPYQLLIRGLSTIYQQTTPLVVVDGVPGVPLEQLDPNDISTIEILKDAASAALYGLRSQQGVILITSKQGLDKPNTVEYRAIGSVDVLAKAVPVMDAQTFSKLNGVKNYGAETNWQKEITRNAFSMQHNLALNGKLGNSHYRMSLNYRDINGILRKSGFNQYSAQGQLNHEAFHKRLNIHVRSGILSRGEQPGLTDAFRSAVPFNPTVPVKNGDGYFHLSGFEGVNPVSILEQSHLNQNSIWFFGAIKTSLKLYKGLSADLHYSQNQSYTKNTAYYERTSLYRNTSNKGSGNVSEQHTQNRFYENNIKFEHKTGKNQYKLAAAYSWQELQDEGFTAGMASGILLDELGIDNLGAFQNYYQGQGLPSSFRHPDIRLVAFSGEGKWNYADKLYVNGCWRREGASNLPVENQWHNTYGLSMGVQLDKITAIALPFPLRFRISFGESKGMPIQGGLTRDRFAPRNSQFYFSNGQYLPVYGYTFWAGNSQLKPEEKSEFNIGFDWMTPGQGLSGNFNVYFSQSDNLLVPRYSGALYQDKSQLMWVNSGIIQDIGFEGSLMAKVINRQRRSLSLGFNFFSNNPRLRQYLPEVNALNIGAAGPPGMADEYYLQWNEGDRIGKFYVREFAGVSDDGKTLVVGKDGNPTDNYSAANYTDAGSALPRIQMGLQTDIRFGPCSVKLLFRSALGHRLAHEWRVFHESNSNDNLSWNKVTTRYYNENLRSPNIITSNHLERANFLRLEQLIFQFQPRLKASRAYRYTLLFCAQGLFNLSAYSGANPEPRFFDVTSPVIRGQLKSNLDYLAPGIDRRNTYSQAKSFSIGANISL